MSHYVAYHSSRVMGRDYVPEKNLSFLTNKPRGVVLASVGATAWVIVGKPASRRMQYLLAGAYTPRGAVEKDGVWTLDGPGVPLVPRLDVTNLPWFTILLREQNNFSLGFNRIKDQAVIEALLGLIPLNRASEAVSSGSD